MADDDRGQPTSLLAGNSAAAGVAGIGRPGPPVATASIRERRLPGWVLGVGGVLLAVSAAALVTEFRDYPRQLWTMLDLHIYLWGGRLARHSGNPYGGTHQSYHLYFTYTPMAAAFFALFTGLKLVTVKWLMTVASVVSLVAVLWLTLGALGYRRSAGRLGAALGVAALALWLEPVQQTLAFGQVNLVLMLIIVADLCLPDRCWFKGIGVGLAAGFKLTPLIFIPYLLLTRRFRAAAVSAGTFALTVAGSLVLLPKAAHRYWLDGLFANAQRTGNVAYVGNQSLSGALSRLLGGSTAAHPYWLAAAAVVALAGLALAAWACRRGQEMAGILTCALTGLLVSPISWSHHWVWIAPMLVVAADMALHAGSLSAPRWWRWAGWLGLLAMGALYFAYPFHLAPGDPRLPEGLIWTVPSPAIQGAGMEAFQQVIGNAYVLVGLLGLAVIGAGLVLTRRQSDFAGPA